MKLNLITESTEDFDVIEEGTDTKKNLVIKGVFMQSERKNRNGRVYPKGVLESAVNQYVEEQVRTNRSVGELNHPTGPTVNLDKVSHLITKLEWDGDNVIGEAKILDTPMGRIAEGLIRGGVQLAVSTRGLGKVVESRGVKVIADGFRLATVDIVQNPSAHDAFVDGIMEGVEFFVNGQECIAEEIQKSLRRDASEAARIKAFQDFLKAIIK